RCRRLRVPRSFGQRFRGRRPCLCRRRHCRPPRGSPVRRLPLALALAAVVVTPAFAAQRPAPVPLTLRPGVPAVTPAAAQTPASEPSPPSASAISQSIFGGGPRTEEDDAYGAYQRGLYLTALALALPRAQNNDPAAQTLIGEIYNNGLGVAEDD